MTWHRVRRSAVPTEVGVAYPCFTHEHTERRRGDRLTDSNLRRSWYVPCNKTFQETYETYYMKLYILCKL